jgi:hypothetical protein
MTATNEQILGLLEKWFAALKDCTNPETVTALYAPDAVLVPTLWNGPCFGQKAIRNYFEAEFLPARPEGYLINYSISSTGNVAINQVITSSKSMTSRLSKRTRPAAMRMGEPKSGSRRMHDTHSFTIRSGKNGKL